MWFHFIPFGPLILFHAPFIFQDIKRQHFFKVSTIPASLSAARFLHPRCLEPQKVEATERPNFVSIRVASLVFYPPFGDKKTVGDRRYWYVLYIYMIIYVYFKRAINSQLSQFSIHNSHIQILDRQP